MVEKWPQQIFTVVDGLEFSSQFDSGNLCRVECRGKDTYYCYTYRECDDSSHCAWFYFSISTKIERRVTIFVRNLNNQSRLYGEGGHRTMYKNTGDWKPVPAHEWLGCTKTLNGICIRFRPKLVRGTTYFAFCHPISYEEVQTSIEELEACFPAVLKRELLCQSALGRRVDVLTVGNEPLEDKPVILASARVHPGETPGHFMLFGMLWYLLSDTPEAAALRETVVFKFVPMLNPDGVYLGKYRTNSIGLNLNRFYCDPQSKHEAVGPLKDLATSLPSLVAYFDFHGHANKRGAFCYGNNLSSNLQNECHQFMKHIGKCSSYFDASRCNFGLPNTKLKDKSCPRDDETTEGSSRVQIHKATHLIHAYTLEAHYATDNRQRPMNTSVWKGIGAAVAQAVFYMDFPNRPPPKKHVLEKVGGL